ncbi:MAG: hypothetical protein ACI9VI_002424 [Candidatus Azotimanducaceae bacterium]|jgi:hypothetical protein
MMTGFKSNSSFRVKDTLPVAAHDCNEGAILDKVVSLNKSKQAWSRIEFS